MEKTLHGLAEAGVPETVDLWPAINERVVGRRTSEAQMIDEPAGAVARQRARPSRLAPDSPLGWVLAVLSVLILGAGVYAASEPVREVFRDGLPGPGATGTGETTDLGQADGHVGAKEIADRQFRSHVPGVGDEKLRQTKSAGGARVTLVRAYADADSVVVGFTWEDLEGGRRVGGRPVELQPGYDLGSFGVRLTDESGTEFRYVSGGGQLASGPQGHTVVFEPEGEIEPDAKHRFRLEIPILEMPVTSPGVDGDEFRRVGEPLAFDFETPVQPATVVEVDRSATASGITLTLERVTDSPGQPEAVICLKSRDSVRGWLPIGEDMGPEVSIPVNGEGHCLQTPLRRPLDGRSSVSVAKVQVNPLEGKVIRGPWTFEFEAPEAPGS